MNAYYFGCWYGAGHYLRDTRGRDYGYDHTARRWKADMPFSDGKIDGGLTPRDGRKQGDAAIHHRDGWTAVAWHDYSVDSRGGSNSVVFLKGDWTFEQALAEARDLFPQAMDRQPTPALVHGDKHEATPIDEQGQS